MLIHFPYLAVSSFISSRLVATVASWKESFRGGSADLLYRILTSYLEDGYYNAYARHASFVQSSGTGKSRQMDELAKRVVSIPLNLKEDSENCERPEVSCGS